MESAGRRAPESGKRLDLRDDASFGGGIRPRRAGRGREEAHRRAAGTKAEEIPRPAKAEEVVLGEDHLDDFAVSMQPHRAAAQLRGEEESDTAPGCGPGCARNPFTSSWRLCRAPGPREPLEEFRPGPQNFAVRGRKDEIVVALAPAIWKRRSRGSVVATGARADGPARAATRSTETTRWSGGASFGAAGRPLPHATARAASVASETARSGRVPNDGPSGHERGENRLLHMQTVLRLVVDDERGPSQTSPRPPRPGGPAGSA